MYDMLRLDVHPTGPSSCRVLIATLGREARERLLSRLGIAARDRDAAQITRDRATARVVALAARLAERTPKQQQGRRGRRLTRRLSKAIGRASVGTDPAQRAQLLGQLAARRHALALATMPLPSPWSPHSGGEGLVPEPIGGTAALEAAVPSDGPRPHVTPAGDRTAQERGPVPGTDPAPGGSTVPTSGDRETGTASTQAGTEASEPGNATSLDSGEGTGRQLHEVPAQATED